MNLWADNEPDLTGWLVADAVKIRVPSGTAHALVVERDGQRRAIYYDRTCDRLRSVLLP